MSSSVKFEVLNAEERGVRNAGLADVLLAALSAIQHHDEVDHIEACIAQRLHRAQRIAAGRNDVLDDGDPFAVGEAAFELFAGAVTLRLLAHEQQRQAGLHRHGAAQEDSAELGRGEALRRLRQELKVAAAEVGELDRWQLAELAIATVSGDGKQADRILSAALNYIEAHADGARITDVSTERVPL